ncbi:MAG: amidase family protein [Roseivirga sp.]
MEELTIAQIHQALESKTCSCEELVQKYLDRIEKYDKPTSMNSLVITNPNALQKARELDREFITTGKLRKLHCVPMIVKDNYDTYDLQTAGGSLAMKGSLPPDDAYQVRKIREAGAIVLAKSNMAEWAFSPMVSISSIAGETKNPYNLEHTTAGSSGGTAAAVAANLGAIGLGTDTGNSIRGPSSHNALVGLRSTLGLTSRDGIIPLYLRNDVGGPMGRTVEDAVSVFEVIAGYDPADPLTENAKGQVPENYTQFLQKDGLKGARIGIMKALTEIGEPSEEILALFKQAVADMEKAGATVVEVAVEKFDSLRQNQWCPMFKVDLENYLASLGDKAPVKTLDELIATGKYSDYIENNLKYFQGINGDPSADDITCQDAHTDAHRIAFRDAMHVAMDENDVDALIYPSWNNPPAKIGDFSGYKGDNSQIISPHTGQPAFTVPMGYSTGNLPAGIQFLGRMFDEPTLIKLIYGYEQATQHRKAPEGFGELKEE